MHYFINSHFRGSGNCECWNGEGGKRTAARQGQCGVKSVELRVVAATVSNLGNLFDPEGVWRWIRNTEREYFELRSIDAGLRDARKGYVAAVWVSALFSTGHQ